MTNTVILNHPKRTVIWGDIFHLSNLLPTMTAHRIVSLIASATEIVAVLGFEVNWSADRTSVISRRRSRLTPLFRSEDRCRRYESRNR